MSEPAIDGSAGVGPQSEAESEADPGAQPPSRRRGRRWRGARLPAVLTSPMWVLGLVVLVDEIDKNIVRGLIDPLKDHFGVGDFAIGVLLSVQLLFNGLITVPAGYLADRWNRTRAIGNTVVAWSALTAAGAGAFSFPMLVGLRSMLGFGQAVTEPSASSLIGDHYPPQQRGKAFAIQMAMLFAGTGMGVALGGALGQTLGWRAALVIVALPGFLVALLVYRLREPGRGSADLVAAMAGGGAGDGATATATGPRLDAGDGSGAAMAVPAPAGAAGAGTDAGAAGPDGGDGRVAGSPADGSVDVVAASGAGTGLFREGFGAFVRNMIDGLRADMRTIMRIRTMRYALVGVAVLLFTVTAISAWMAQYYIRHLHVAEGQGEVWFMGLAMLGGVPGIIVGGRVADTWAPRVKGGRLALPAWFLFAGTICFSVSYAIRPDEYSLGAVVPAFGLQLAGLFVLSMSVPALRAGLTDALPAHLRGTGFGALNLVAVIFGQAAAPFVVSAISSAYDENLRVAFLMITPLSFLGASLLYRASKFLDEDMQQIMFAVLTALQEEVESKSSPGT